MGSDLPQKIALKVTWMYSFWLKGKPFLLASSIFWFSVVRIANNCGIYYQLRWGLGHSLCTRVKVKRILPCDSVWDFKLHLNGYSPGSSEIRFQRAQTHFHKCIFCLSCIKLPESPHVSVFCLFCLCTCIFPLILKHSFPLKIYTNNFGTFSV